MSAPLCHFCERPVERRTTDTYVEQSGWSLVRAAGGSNQLSLRKETGEVAHGPCVRLAIRGIDPARQGQIV